MPVDKLLFRLQALKNIEIKGQVDPASYLKQFEKQLSNNSPPFEYDDILTQTQRQSIMEDLNKNGQLNDLLHLTHQNEHRIPGNPLDMLMSDSDE